MITFRFGNRSLIFCELVERFVVFRPIERCFFGFIFVFEGFFFDVTQLDSIGELSLLSIQKDLYGSEAPREIVSEIEQFIPKHWTRPITWLQAQVLRNTIRSTNIKDGDRMAQLMWEMLEGKATIQVEAREVPATKKNYDLSKLTLEELRLWRSLMIKAMIVADE